MEVFRVVTATGNVTKPQAVESAKEFLSHALQDFEKFENTEHDKEIKQNLVKLASEMFKLNDVPHRLRWAEIVLTNQCRLVVHIIN